MSVVSQKLKYQKSSTTHEISLYNSAVDVDANYWAMRAGGYEVYFGLTTYTGSNRASDLRGRETSSQAMMKEALIDFSSGTIVMSIVSCPSGWTRVSAWDNTYIRAAATPGGTGGGSHTHDVTVPARTTSTYTYTSGPNVGLNPDTFPAQGESHSHSFPSVVETSEVGINLPAYYNIIFCKKD